jgi:methyl-accepting chemotaxis protein
MHIDFVAITDKDNHIVYGSSYDRAAKQKTEPAPGILEHLKPGSLLLKHAEVGSTHYGLIELPEGPMMVASLAVVNSKGEGPVQGAFVVGRRFDDETLQRLSSYTLSTIKLVSLDSNALPPDFARVKDEVVQNGGILTQSVAPRVIAGYKAVADIYGKPILIFSVEMSTALYRDIIHQGNIITILAFLGLSAGLFGVIWYLLGRKVLAPLSRLVLNLKSVADLLGNTSRKITDSSRDLAEGAQEQAASIEHSSSTLIELSNQSQDNSEHTRKVDSLMAGSRQLVGGAAQAIQQAEAAMQAIKDSAGQVTGIMRLIEEIAFKTNLLSLNAAVEAARAGEHGRGFAVVAEEVRTLAQQSAAAARDTAAIITTSVQQANSGAEIMQRASRVMSELSANAEVVAGDIGAITRASEQQSEGVGQLNEAITQIDQVTQRIASHSELVAMDCQGILDESQRLHGIMGDLIAMAGNPSAKSAS